MHVCEIIVCDRAKVQSHAHLQSCLLGRTSGSMQSLPRLAMLLGLQSALHIIYAAAEASRSRHA